MKVNVKYFASLKESLGRAEDVVELDQELTVMELWRQVSGEHDLPENILTAVNMEYVKADTKLKADDEVAFFPPVTGG